MNIEQNLREDQLRDFLNPGEIEKAPDGFTGRMMNRLSVEPVPVLNRAKGRNYSLVPAISAVVTLALVVIAIIFDTGKSQSADILWSRVIKAFQPGLPAINFTLPELTVSNIIVYIMSLSILLLVFDLVLSGYFGRRKSTH